VAGTWGPNMPPEVRWR